MSRVKSLSRDVYYDRKQRMPGDEYDVDERDMPMQVILSKLGKVKILAAQPAAASSRSYQTAAVKVEEPEPKKPAAAVMTTENEALTPRRRVYRRRDMEAEK